MHICINRDIIKLEIKRKQSVTVIQIDQQYTSMYVVRNDVIREIKTDRIRIEMYARISSYNMPIVPTKLEE